MLKLSKYHVKIAEESTEPKAEEDVISAPEEDDMDDGLEDDKEEKHEKGSSKTQDPRQEAATPHANAAKDLFNKRRELMNQVNMLDDQLSKHREVLRALDPKAKHEAYVDDKELRHYLKPEKMEEKKKVKKLDRKAELEVIENLIKVANILDFAGDERGLGVVEDVLRIFAKKEDSRPIYGVETIEKTKREYPEVQAPAPAMSTRHCPDHNGTMMQRVAEGSYQCNIDGKIYNWNVGFKDYNGNVHPGSQISSVDFPDMNERIFENRSMALSKRNQ